MIPVPDGTVARDKDGLVADLVGEGARAVVARGGRGGRGNASLAGPKNLPTNIVLKLNAEVRRINKTSKMRAHFERLALSTMDLDPAAVAKFIADEYAFWAPLAKEAGLTVQ